MGILSKKPLWAPKVPRSKIRRLYETDALGILDTGLIDEVGWALWQRCESILTVTAAHYGHVRCPECASVIERQDPWSEGEQVRCPGCGWQIAWKDYHQTYRGKQLFGANSVENFEAYHHDFPLARTPAEKMLLVDNLIHSFHLSLLHGIGRPAATNLLEGSLAEVIQFLDGLSSSGSSAAGLVDSRSLWRSTMEKAGWADGFLPKEKN